MLTFLIVVAVFIGLLALAGTLYAGKQVNASIENMDVASPEEQEKLLKANYYKNAKSNIKLMVMIYSILVLVFVVGLLIYVFML